MVPTVADQGQAVAMSAQVSSTISGAALTYTWNFGDGNQQSGVNLTDVTHAYTAPSPSNTPYVVTLTVTDGDQPASAIADLTINDVPPTISAGLSQTVRAGSTVQFNGSASDAGGSSQIASIQWDFTYDGSHFNPDTSADGNLTPSYTYTTPGTYTVALQVTDQNGGVSQDFTTVIVKPANALLVNAGPDITVTAGQNVTLSGSYDDPSGTVNSSGIAWDTNYNGQTFNPVVTGMLTPTVSFATPGNYQVALQITDSNNARDISVLNVTVNPVSYTGPTATAGSDQTINEGDTASFNGSYTDPDGAVSSSGIAWDFNYDGVSFNPMATGTLTPSYQFTTPGDYTVALQVTDSNGLTSLSTLNVTVNAVPPTVNAGSNLTVIAGQLVQFNGSASIPSGANDSLDYAWDFNYDGQNFNPGSASTLNPYYVFTTVGTHTVALQATDSEGVSNLSTLTVTINPSNALVVNAGPDQAINEGDTAAFSASYTDGSGTVDPSTAQWDFNYDGSHFVADPSANGTLTPSHQFTTPGNYLVAVQLTDSNNVTSLGVMYVSVAGVPPAIDAGPDQTVNQGDTVQFAGTASVPSGVNTTLSYAWDFDYDGQNFVADPSANGTLTPTHVFSTPGTYEVALQVTDGFGQTSLATLTVTVNDVPPTATVSGPGTVNAGSPATFTISNLQDLTPNDAPTFLADWEGTGQFEEITPDEITINPDGSLSFTHIYDVPGSYNAVIEILDGNGGSTDYTTNVVVNDVAPTAASFGPNVDVVDGNFTGSIDASVPIYFNGVSDPSLADTLAGFTYYVSLDGGAYSSSNSPVYYLPAGISQGSHTLTGYIEDSYDLSSPIYSTTVTVQSPQVGFYNYTNSTGQVQLSWTGGSPVVLDPGQGYVIDGTAPGLTVTLLTNQGVYVLSTTGSIDAINAAAGVTGVNLNVSALDAYMLDGNGDIGEIDLPADSKLSVYARGDVGNIVGAPGSSASQLTFTNLTGSITGLNSIGALWANGWLGTSPTQVIDVAAGIGDLSAYGVGATVEADQNQDASDQLMSVNVGDGGVPGEIDAGNVIGFLSTGNVNVLKFGYLEGDLTLQGPGNTFLTLTDGAGTLYANSPGELPSITSDGDMAVNSQKDLNLQKINVKGGLSFDVKGSVKVQGDIVAGELPDSESASSSVITGDLTANNVRITKGNVGTKKGAFFSVEGNITLNGIFEVAEGNILDMGAGKSIKASAIIVRGEGTYIQDLGTGEGDLTSKVEVLNGSIERLKVGRDFLPPTGAQQGDALVSAKQSIDSLSVGRNLGKPGRTAFGKIVAQSIGQIVTDGGDITTNIETTDGNIGTVGKEGANIYGNITAVNGNVQMVYGQLLKGNVAAKSAGDVLTGNIGSVSVGTLESKSITADSSIQSISVVFATAAVTTKIQAQAGGILIQTDDGPELKPNALNLLVKGKFGYVGSMIFTYGKAAPAARVVFAPGAALLRYTYVQVNQLGGDPISTTTTSATVKQTAGDDTGVYVQNATFDFTNAAKPLQGKPKFTKINTQNTPTTAFDVTVTQTKK